jgi:hypothetical protein
MPRRSAFGNVVSENPLTTLAVAMVLGLAVYFLFFNKSGFGETINEQNRCEKEAAIIVAHALRISRLCVGEQKGAISKLPQQQQGPVYMAINALVDNPPTEPASKTLTYNLADIKGTPTQIANAAKAFLAKKGLNVPTSDISAAKIPPPSPGN